jgi:hypothetical protein
MAAKNDRGFDHLVLCVRDLDRARDVYRRLGFTVTPRALHPFGTGNALVQFQDRNYLELLTVVDPARIPVATSDAFSFGAYNQAFLGRHEGFSMLALQSKDAHGDRRRFSSGGLATYPAFDFSRAATLADGSEATVSFSLTFLAEPKSENIAFFVCQHHTPQQFWQPAYQTHPNGAIGVRRVTMTAPEPQEMANFFSKLYDTTDVAICDSQLVVTAGAAEIVVSRSEAMRLAGYRVAVADMKAAQRLLDAAQIGYRLDGDLLVIAPEATFGTQIEFTAA